MASLVFSKEQRTIVEDFVNQRPEEPIGLINVSDRWGYAYFVPMTDYFYKTERFEIPSVEAVLGASEGAVPDNPIFKNLRPTWIEALNAAFAAQPPSGPLYFLDIGLFVGSVSLHVAKHLKTPIHIRTLEPNASNIELARLNFALNGVDAWITHAAASDKTGQVSFWVPEASRIGGQISKDPGRNSFTVDAIDVASWRASDPSNALYIIKIDTEGAEWPVLRGISAEQMKRTLCVILEYWPTDDLAYERYLVENFEIYIVNSAMFSAPPPYQRIHTAEALANWAKEFIAKNGNVDVIMLPRTGANPSMSALRAQIAG